MTFRMLVYNSEQGLASSTVCPEKLLTEVLTESCFITYVVIVIIIAVANAKALW